MKGVTVRIRNFEKYKGRKDVEHNSWFRCSNRLLEDPDFYDFSHAELFVWVYVLSLASQKNTDTVFINFDHADRVCRLPKKVVQSAIEKLSGNQLDPVDVTATLRPRNADDTPTCATDKTDRQDKTDRHECESGDSLPVAAEIWNSTVQSLPKVSKWTKARAKASKGLAEEDWRTACAKIEASDFLSGRSGKWTSCSFDWAIKTANLTKVLEGNYDNRGEQVLTPGTGTPETGEQLASRVLQVLLKHGTGTKAAQAIEQELGPNLWRVVYTAGTQKIRDIPRGPFQLKTVAGMLQRASELLGGEHVQAV